MGRLFFYVLRFLSNKVAEATAIATTDIAMAPYVKIDVSAAVVTTVGDGVAVGATDVADVVA